MMRKLLTAAALLTISVGVFTTPAPVHAVPPGCVSWSGGSAASLNGAISANTCVAVQPGTYYFDAPILVDRGHTLRGVVEDWSSVTFKPASNWQAWWTHILVAEGPGTGIATVRWINLDLANHAHVTGAIGARDMAVSYVQVQNARCWGVAVAGYNFTLHGSYIHHNGNGCPDNLPGAGVYLKSQSAYPSWYAPVITNNWIWDNFGPGLDIAAVWGGDLIGNDIRRNTHWAGMHLFGSYWDIESNDIYHPTYNAPGIPDSYVYWPQCEGGPLGNHTAAILVCQKTDAYNEISVGNNIRNNNAAAYYGILLVGYDTWPGKPYWVPHDNTIENNNLYGSTYACADDLAPGQWYHWTNTWIGCTPGYF